MCLCSIVAIAAVLYAVDDCVSALLSYMPKELQVGSATLPRGFERSEKTVGSLESADEITPQRRMMGKILEMVRPYTLETCVVVVNDQGAEVRSWYTSQSRHFTRWGVQRAIKGERMVIGEPVIEGRKYSVKIGVHERFASAVDDIIDEFKYYAKQGDCQPGHQ